MVIEWELNKGPVSVLARVRFGVKTPGAQDVVTVFLKEVKEQKGYQKERRPGNLHERGERP